MSWCANFEFRVTQRRDAHGGARGPRQPQPAVQVNPSPPASRLPLRHTRSERESGRQRHRRQERPGGDRGRARNGVPPEPQISEWWLACAGLLILENSKTRTQLTSLDVCMCWCADFEFRVTF